MFLNSPQDLCWLCPLLLLNYDANSNFYFFFFQENDPERATEGTIKIALREIGQMEILESIFDVSWIHTSLQIPITKTKQWNCSIPNISMNMIAKSVSVFIWSCGYAQTDITSICSHECKYWGKSSCVSDNCINLRHRHIHIKFTFSYPFKINIVSCLSIKRILFPYVLFNVTDGWKHELKIQ